MSYTINAKNIKLNKLHIQKQIEYTQKLLGVLADIRTKFIEVCKKYDGKIYTKRFANAVQELSPLVRVDFTCSRYLELKVSDWNNRHYTADIGQGGYICTSYVSDDTISIYLDSAPLCEKKLVLNADKLIENFDKAICGRQASLQNKIKNLQNIDNLVKEFAELYNKYETFNNNLDYQIKELFGFKL